MPAEDMDRLQRLLPHWIEHSLEHAETYRQWASTARNSGDEATAERLERAASLTEEIAAVLRIAMR